MKEVAVWGGLNLKSDPQSPKLSERSVTCEKGCGRDGFCSFVIVWFPWQQGWALTFCQRRYEAGEGPPVLA